MLERFLPIEVKEAWANDIDFSSYVISVLFSIFIFVGCYCLGKILALIAFLILN
jgi:hypothetical protein